jgi:hypothetical protein
LLADNGKGLFALSLDGHRRLLWRHARIDGLVAAASPDGQELAYVVSVPRPTGQTSFLYLLARNGRVKLVDRASDWIHGVAFLRPPGHPRGAVRLHWIRNDVSNEFLRVRLRVLRAGQVRDVPLHLRPGEFAADLTGYPGSSIYAVEIGSRYGAIDTLLYGLAEGAPEPLHLWDTREPPAWPTPFELVAHTISGIQLYLVACGPNSRIVVGPNAVDNGDLNEGDWPFVALDEHHVTVIPPLHARGEGEAMMLGRHPQPVDLLDLRTGRLERVRLRYFSPQTGAGWVVVHAPRSSDFSALGSGRCATLHHQATP